MEPLRIALIGKTGAGKSALGNTLLGKDVFESKPGAESVTRKCEKCTETSPIGKLVTIVDTPGIMDTNGRDVRDEVTKAIAALSPGPHAFLIVLRPDRATDEERNVISQLKGLFGDESFLNHSIIIMTRKNEITNDEDRQAIHTFIEKNTDKGVKELYRLCGKRIVAVENMHYQPGKKRQYAVEVLEEVIKIGGYYVHDYFKILEEKKIQAEETTRLRREIEKVAEKKKTSFCTIL